MFKCIYNKELKKEFLNLFLSDASKDDIISKLNISSKDYNMLTLILKLRNIKEDDLLEGEEWKSLSFLGFPYYKVSNLGRVSRLGKIKALIIDRYGYYKVNLYHLNDVKTFGVHRLVLLAFSENKRYDLTVNHIDGDRLNNNLNNLEWADSKYQAYHRDNIGPNKGKNSERVSGSLNPMAKLNEEIVLSIYNEPKELSNSEVSKKYSVPYERVRLIRKGEVWKHLTQGSTTSRKT